MNDHSKLHLIVHPLATVRLVVHGLPIYRHSKGMGFFCLEHKMPRKSKYTKLEKFIIRGIGIELTDIGQILEDSQTLNKKDSGLIRGLIEDLQTIIQKLNLLIEDNK